MNRRGFLSSILALSSAPAIVRASSLMSLWLPPEVTINIVQIGGQVVWVSDPRYHALEKAAGDAVETTYAYEADVLMALDSKIADLSGVTIGSDAFNRDGKLVKSYRRCTLYDGGKEQLPDPKYAEAVGEANAVAYRGRRTVFIEGLSLDGGGRLPGVILKGYARGRMR